ncbi:MAG: two-component regulator propeller domain-containing protein [Pedobacter sp.]|uniref:hybrid sensor histidine kinase/response regulator transcription factor n=1 Tax=Pedobacter sp. TaxID=1411316 RepID=UPI0033988D19
MRLYLILFLMGMSLAASPQNAEGPGDKIIPDLLFDRFSNKEGLPENRIRSIFQDSRGYLWVGTMNGIGKYDGYGFRKYYNQNSSSSISGNWAFAICEDAAGNIWIGTLSGLNVFDSKKEKFKSYKNTPSDKSSLFSNKITALHFDPSGKLWVGTQDGLARFDPVTGKFQTFKQSPLNTYISKIIKSEGDQIWIATASGVVQYNTKTNVSNFYQLKVKPDPYGNYFWSLMEDKGDLYIATATQGMIRLGYDAQTGRYQQNKDLNIYPDQDLSHTEVFDLCKSPSGDLWLATDQGLARIQKPGTTAAKLHLYKNNPLNGQSLSHNTVYQVFIDRTNNLWCGTEMGLNKLDLNALSFQYFTFQDPRAEDQVRSLYSINGRDIWMGTARNAIYKYNLVQNTTQTFRLNHLSPAFNSHRSLYVDEHNQVYLGTLGGALQLNQQQPNSSVKISEGGAVFAFLKDRRGNLWLGKNDGLLQIKKDGSHVTYKHDPKDMQSLSSSFVRSLFEDHNGKIWIGFETSGLSYFDPLTGKFIRVSGNKAGEHVSGNIIYSILEHPKNVLWAGSESGLNKLTLQGQRKGLYRLRIRNYFEKDGLPDKSVNGILTEKGNFLWISSIKGLARMDIAREQFEPYLPTLNFSFSCAYKFSPHQLLFGTSDGILIFDPDKISKSHVLPEVMISELKLFNEEVAIDSTYNGEIILEQSLNHTREISLGYKNNVFTLGFIGLHFSDPANNSYAYQMEGFDKDWIYTTANERSITYTNLDPGTYYFKVKAANNYGKWNQRPAVLKINILPPPWETWWAIVAYLIILSVLTVLLTNFLTKKSKQRNALETERLLRLKDVAIHQEQLSFFTNITHELQTPLTLINGSIERFFYRNSRMVNQPKEAYFLSVVHQQSSRLTYLVNQLLDFRKAEAGHLKSQESYLDVSSLLANIAELFVPLCDKKNLEYSIEVDPGIVGWMDKDKLEKIIFNLLSNAFKHSDQNQSIIFEVSRDPNKDMLQIVVKNSGCQLSPVQLSKIFEQFFVVDSGQSDKYSNGIGLAFTRELVKLLKGTINALNENNWIIFKVILPLLNKVKAQAEPDVVQSPLAHTPSYLLRSITANNDDHEQLSTKENNKRALIAGLEQTEKKSILIVEDEPAIRFLLKDLLEENYILYEAENGRQAIELLMIVTPNLIISDVMMPEVNGLELCYKVKNSPDTCHIPFILLSARGSIEQKTEGYDAGADAYIPKPFDTMHLLVRVRKLLEYRQRLHDIFKTEGPSVGLEEKNLADNDKRFLNNLVQIIQENLEDTEMDAAFLESRLAISKMQLYRKLKSLSNMTPGEFIKHIRLHHTVHLLQSTQLTVSEIFYRSGFNNQSHFYREFKKRFQCSPSEYRSQQRIHV